MRWFRRLAVLLVVVFGLLGGVLFALLQAFGSDPYAGASIVTNAAPWPSTDGATVYGECNEAFVSAMPNGANATDGFGLQIACQGEVPAGSEIQDVSGSVPINGQCFPTSTSWSCGSVTAGWAQDPRPFDVAGNYANAVGANSLCEASTGGVSNDIFSDWGWYLTPNQTTTTVCANTGTFWPVSSPAGSPFCSGSSSVCYGDVTQVQNLSLGPSELASNGKAVQSFSLFEDVFTAGNDMACVSESGYTCGGLSAQPTSGRMWPDAPLYGSGTSCNGSTNYASATSQTSFNGAAITGMVGTNLLSVNLYSQPSGDGWYGGGGGQADLQLDSFVCESGPAGTGTQYVGLPSTYFTGGGTVPFATYCGLSSVSGWPPAPSGDNPTFVAGHSYSLTFNYFGGVAEIAIDPGDETGGGPTLAPTYVLGSDATLVGATGSPQAVSWTPTTGGKLNPQIWCLGTNGQVYSWGTGQGMTNSGPGSGTTGGNQVCTTGADGQLICATAPTDTGLASCFASAGWSLTDPVSWVTGALHDGVCILEWLFVPSPSSLSSFVNLFAVSSSGTTSASVGQWLGAMTTIAADAPTTAVADIQTAAGGGCSGPSLSVDGHSFGECSALAAASSSTSWTLIDGIVAAVFGVLMALALFRIVQRVLSSGA